MHNLLCMKGYRFPSVSAQAKALLNAPKNQIKTEKELEEEDKDAQGAVRYFINFLLEITGFVAYRNARSTFSSK